MKNFYIHISSLIIVVLVFMSSCQHKPNTTIAQALLLAGEHPDSALALLNNMQFSELGKSEQAKYAVVYTMAQDKSGLDVDEDSLIRHYPKVIIDFSLFLLVLLLFIPYMNILKRLTLFSSRC